MLNAIKVLVISFLLHSSSAILTKRTTNNTEAKLIFAHVLFRHGDRNPIETYPTDPWKNESNWPEGFGQLTNVGIQQQYELGKYLRTRYQSLIGDAGYSNENVYIQSTDYDRTLMSAAANLAGLFPPVGDQIWNTNLSWQPIPIHTMPTKEDFALLGPKGCPRYDQGLRKYYDSVEYATENKKHKQLYKYLEKNARIRVHCPGAAHNIHNVLWIEQLKNKTLPEWTKKVFGAGSEFEVVAHSYFLPRTNTPEMARLYSGFLIREIFDRCAQKINSTLKPNRSLWLYSAHDSTIIGILNSFGLFNKHNPPYASSLLFELYKSKDQYYLQLLYRNTTEHEPYLLHFPSCGTKCSIDKLRNIYKEIIPTGDTAEECKLPLKGIFENNDFCGSNCMRINIALACLVLVMPFLTIVSWKYFTRRRSNITLQPDNQFIYTTSVNQF